jgi:hypothetical protein
MQQQIGLPTVLNENFSYIVFHWLSHLLQKQIYMTELGLGFKKSQKFFTVH